MASLTIRRLNEGLKSRLRLRAAHHGRSMEEEAREILKKDLTRQPVTVRNLAEAIRSRLAPLGGVELPVQKRELIRRPPKLAR
jgi:plasmid stability protein